MSRTQSQRLRPGNSTGGSRSAAVPDLLSHQLQPGLPNGHRILLFPFLHWLRLVRGNHLRLPGAWSSRRIATPQEQAGAAKPSRPMCRRNDDFVSAGKQSVDGARSRPGQRAVADSFGESPVAAPPITPPSAPIAAPLSTLPTSRPLFPACSTVPSFPFTLGPSDPGKLLRTPGTSTTWPLGKIMVVKCRSSCARPLTRPGRTTRSTTPCT